MPPLEAASSRDADPHGSGRVPRQVIWNGRMREELLAQLEEQRASPDIAAATGFSFAALEGELTVAGVFVRVFVEQPGFAIADPAAYCKARCFRPHATMRPDLL